MLPVSTERKAHRFEATESMVAEKVWIKKEAKGFSFRH